MKADEVNKSIYCKCYFEKYGRYKMLGSVTDQGMLEIARGNHNFTYVKAEEYYINCADCGFSKYIKNESTAVNRPAEYEKQN